VKAVVYDGPRKVSVKDVPDARIERPTDVLVRITSANICGSDLHMYEGRTDFETGRWFGHENLGQVIEVGDGVDKVRSASTSSCRSTSPAGTARTASAADQLLPDRPAGAEVGRAAYGFADMGPLGPAARRAAAGARGADFNCLRLGEDAEERQTDYVHAGRHLPDRLPRHRDGQRQAG
jgi:glutathione-independent formaldehyde dehydrogenase